MEGKAGYGTLTRGQADWLPSSLWEMSLETTRVERISEHSFGRHLLPRSQLILLTTFLALSYSLTASHHSWI